MNTKRIIPIVTGIIGLIFMIIGITQLGFWHAGDGPMPGFFPAIMAGVMLIISIFAFVQSLKESQKPDYKREELLVILVGMGIFAASFIVGLIPSCLLFVVSWLKWFEKESWKNIAIVTGIVAAIAIGVFGMWLGIQFPMGIFEYL